MKRNMKPTKIAGLVFAILGFAVLFQNCGGGFHSIDASGLSIAESIRNTGSNNGTIGTTVDPVSGLQVYSVPKLCSPIRVTPTVDLLRPVLATRNTACIMCHAQINGDLVTDFGYGDPFFFGLDSADNHPLQKSYYGPFGSKHFSYEGNGWAGSSVMGDVYVPDTTMTDKRILAAWVGGGNAAAAGVKLVDFLSGTYLDGRSNTLMNLLPKVNSTDAGYSDIATAGIRGSFKSRKDIWIDAPTADELRTLKDMPGAVSVLAKLGLSITKSATSDVLVGLSAHESTKTHKLYAENDDVLTCRGDVVVDGILFLNDVKLATDDKGCRLYVTGTVFIVGPVTYVNGGNSNIQISSASAIIMGMRSLKPRLVQANQDGIVDNVGGVRLGWTDDDELAINAKIFNDRDSVDDLTDDAGPWKTLTDAGGNVLAYLADYDNYQFALPAGVTTVPNVNCTGCTFTWAGAYGRKSVDYTHMVLNAPKVYSRYYGKFQGVIIAEDVLFAIGNFHFESDPVMSKISLLPLVGDRVFSMSSD